MEICNDGHKEICFGNERWNTKCPLCELKETSDKEIQKLNAEIKNLNTEVDDLNEEIENLKTKEE